MIGGQRADPKVDVASTNPHLDAAVLGHPPLGDVHPGHDLVARGDRGLHVLGDVVANVADPVYPITHPNTVGHRLDMNIARPPVYRLGDDQVDQLDDRGVSVLARHGPTPVTLCARLLRGFLVDAGHGL